MDTAYKSKVSRPAHKQRVGGVRALRSQEADETDTIAVINRLVAQSGVAELIAVIAEMTKEKSDHLLLAGESHKAALCMRDFRILQRAAQMLRY